MAVATAVQEGLTIAESAELQTALAVAEQAVRPKKLDRAALMAGMVKTPAAKAGEPPLVAVTADLAAKIRQRMILKAQLGDLEAKVKELDADILPAAEVMRREACRGDFTASIKLGGLALYVWFTKTFTCVEADLRAALGPAVETHGTLKPKFVVDASKLPDEQFVQIATIAPGAVTAKVEYKPNERFASDFTLDPVFAAKARQVCKPVAYLNEVG